MTPLSQHLQIAPERTVGTRPMHQFRELSGFDTTFIKEINNHPYRYSDEEHAAYLELCDKTGYYYDQIAAANAGKFTNLFQVSGNYQKYLPYLLDYKLPILISNQPEHSTFHSYHSRAIICCETEPKMLWQCATLPIYIFGGKKQRMFTQFIHDDPKLIVDLFMKIYQEPLYTVACFEVINSKGANNARHRLTTNNSSNIDMD